MGMELGAWFERGVRILFWFYRAVAAWEDFRYRAIRLQVFAGFGIAGGVLRFGVLCLSFSLPGRWEAALADVGLAMLVGVALLALSILTRQAVGAGDGWFFVVSALYLGLQRNVLLLLGGLTACFIYCSVLLVWGRLRCVSVRKRKVPFLPFLIPVCLGMACL